MNSAAGEYESASNAEEVNDLMLTLDRIEEATEKSSTYSTAITKNG
jgi:hypothetical protein